MSARRVGPPDDDAELEELAPILVDSLNVPPERAGDLRARYDRTWFRLVREGGRVVGGLALVPAGQFFGGRRVDLAAVNAVAVAQEARGRGVARDLLTAAVRGLGAPGGPPLAALFPATQPLYRRVGFEQAGTYTEYRVPLTAIAPGPHDLDVERLPADTEVACDRLGALYRRHAARRAGWLDRTPWFWQRLVQPTVGSRSTYAVVSAGEVCGYVSFRRRWDVDGHSYTTLHCQEIVADHPAALRRLWTLLADERSLGRSVVFTGPPAPAELLPLVEQKQEVAFQMRWMLRLLDVEAALAARGYLPGLEREVTFEVTDDLLERNCGRFTLSVAGGRGQVTRDGGGPAVRVDVRGLAALYSGYLPAEELARVGMADGADPALAAATAAFAGAPPWLPEIF